MMEYESRITEMTHCTKGVPLFHESSITIRIEDESGGEFLVVSQSTDAGPDNCIRIDPEEWPTLRDVIDRMHAQCRGDVQ